jgi:NADPH:quinone reductase-like Zn-dependent oxidoreductase
MSIRALVVDPAAIDGMRLTDVPEPAADSDEVVIDVHHVSLNHGARARIAGRWIVSPAPR